jgi:sugar phosphate isomerase/epimerase
VKALNFAVSTWSYLRAYSDEANLEQAIREITEGGFRVELWLHWSPDPDAFEESRWERIRELVGGAPLSIHTALTGCTPELFKKEVDIAAGLGASLIVAHEPTLGFKLEEELVGLDCCREINEYASSRNVRVALENGPFTTLDRTVAKIGHEVDVCLDVGHANMTQGGISAFLERFGPRIAHVHLSDNYGEDDDHLVPGEGYISMEDWRNLFKTLHDENFAGNVVFEINTRDPKRDAKRAREFIDYVIRSMEK